MVRELKVKISDYREVEKLLTSKGGQFTHELNVTDSYFNQPAGRVLKISEDERGTFLVELEADAGGFEIRRYEQIGEGGEVKEELEQRHGIRCILKKKRRFFTYKDAVININLIEGLGDFLVLEAEAPDPQIIEDDLGLRNPEYIRVPFDELKLAQTLRSA